MVHLQKIMKFFENKQFFFKFIQFKFVDEKFNKRLLKHLMMCNVVPLK